jgi:hypothetical protein
MRTIIALALLVLLSGTACAHDPEPTPCGRTRCPPSQQEKVERAIQQEQVNMMRRVIREGERAFWRMVRGK